MQPAHHLPGTERLLATFGEPVAQRGQIEVEQVDGHPGATISGR